MDFLDLASSDFLGIMIQFIHHDGDLMIRKCELYFSSFNTWTVDFSGATIYQMSFSTLIMSHDSHFELNLRLRLRYGWQTARTRTLREETSHSIKF